MKKDANKGEPVTNCCPPIQAPIFPTLNYFLIFLSHIFLFE